MPDAIYLSDFDTQFTTESYFSQNDVASEISAESIAESAVVVARTLHNLMKGETYYNGIPSDDFEVRNLCFADASVKPPRKPCIFIIRNQLLSDQSTLDRAYLMLTFH